jgi:predicted O-methyltransferase YrrM
MTNSSSSRLMKFRPFMCSPEESGVSSLDMRLRHPIFAWLRLRPIFAQHTLAEHEALQRWAKGRGQIVEIGVAEGGSALALREVIAPDGTLHLIDPFHLSRLKWMNGPRRAAAAAVSMSTCGRVRWINKFSFEAVRNWTEPIDFLFLDGDHDEKAVWRDWEEWHCFISRGGIIAFHDARVFVNGWPTDQDGPVRVVNLLFRGAANPEWAIVEEVDSIVFVERRA